MIRCGPALEHARVRRVFRHAPHLHRLVQAPGVHNPPQVPLLATTLRRRFCFLYGDTLNRTTVPRQNRMARVEAIFVTLPHANILIRRATEDKVPRRGQTENRKLMPPQNAAVQESTFLVTLPEIDQPVRRTAINHRS